MATKRERKAAVTQRIAGPVDIGSTRFPLSSSSSLDYVAGVHRLVFGRDAFFIVLYGAYNAHGLIGTERNGIAVLDENRGRVVLLDHARGAPRLGQASDAQRGEFARICGMDADQFRLFVNGHPGAECRVLTARPRPIVIPSMGGLSQDFHATPYNTREDKQQFLAALIRFLCHHCDRDRFTRRIYEGLSLHLGHISHFNASGFYGAWFADADARVRFLERHAQERMLGNWRDVHEAFKLWIEGQEGRTVLDFYRAERDAAVDAEERQQYEALRAKFERKEA